MKLILCDFYSVNNFREVNRKLLEQQLFKLKLLTGFHVRVRPLSSDGFSILFE